MGVKLRFNEKKNVKSFFLDINNNNNRIKEYLGLHLIKATTQAERERNKEVKQLAESIRAKRELEIQASGYEYTPAFKRKTDFISYYEKFLEKYTNQDIRIVKYSFEHLKKFVALKGFKSGVMAKDITEELCQQFKSYLTENLNGETPCNYFTKFKKVLKQATKDKIIKENPAEEIRNTKTSGLKKDILNINEISKLAQTPCGSDNVKRAFLFSLNTGLRWCDLKLLKWKNIDLGTNKFKITQEKTKHSSKDAILNSDLNSNALKVIGKKGKPDEFVFNLPSHSASSRTLKRWVKKAGIDKSISWHCARHSFGVNMLDTQIGNADVKTVASALGHSSIKYMDVYSRVIDERKKQAINNLPEIKI
ncbi:MAG: site-specific integrase [Bacteroidales bacterium]|jgi:integrase